MSDLSTMKVLALVPRDTDAPLPRDLTDPAGLERPGDPVELLRPDGQGGQGSPGRPVAPAPPRRTAPAMPLPVLTDSVPAARVPSPAQAAAAPARPLAAPPEPPRAPSGAGHPPAPPAEAAAPGFEWPTPPAVGQARGIALSSAEPCEIETAPGHVTAGILMAMDAQTGMAVVRMGNSRRTLPLKFQQFRRLTLLRPLAVRGKAAAALLDSARGLRLTFRDEHSTELASLGHVETAAGIFTFEPINDNGQVQRSFFPRVRLARVQQVAAAADPAPAAPAAATRKAPAAPVAALAMAPTPTAPSRPAPRAALEPATLPATEITRAEDLIAALDQQARMPLVRIGEALLALGFITEQALGDALQAQTRDRSQPLGELLVKKGLVSRVNLQTALARKMGYPLVDVDAFPVEQDAALRLPVALARRLTALPLILRSGQLVVALEDPSARSAIDEIEFSAQCKVLPVLARAGVLTHAIERVYQRLGKDAVEPSEDLLRALSTDTDTSDAANKLLASLEQQSTEGREEDPQIAQSDNSLVKLINTMILEARSQGVSDIHIECPPGTEKVRVRFRRDGVLRPYMELPHTYRNAVLGRLKIMCDLDISERRKPQDGKISFGKYVQGQRLELRVATIPTANGLEDVVLRLLSSARTLPLEAMNLQPETLARLISVIERPYGMVLCVGPTGSGKTTTLHAALRHINTPDRKIWTAEDPVEITQAGLRQVQVNPKIDWTFAKALRAFLRADPDVVMVGEIRDAETAQMAVEASLTGHLVLSTLHTNSAPETVTRLLDMGIDPFSFADSLLAVLAQRLVRRWCRHCVTSRPATHDEVTTLLDEYRHCHPEPERSPPAEQLLSRWLQAHGQPQGADGQRVLMHHHAPGCSQCGQSGYAGRVGLHELMLISRNLRRLIQTKATADGLQQEAMTEGMCTLRQDGIHKVLAGLTSIEEVRATSNG